MRLYVYLSCNIQTFLSSLAVHGATHRDRFFAWVFGHSNQFMIISHALMLQLSDFIEERKVYEYFSLGPWFGFYLEFYHKSPNNNVHRGSSKSWQWHSQFCKFFKPFPFLFRRGTTQTTATAGAVPQQILTAASTLGIPPPSADFKTTEQILRELKDYRPKTPLLPPLYTIR